MIPHSVLDLASVGEGLTPADALAASAELARHAEALGYARYWLAEHHNMAGIASAATAVVIGHVAAATRKIRVGAGGVMLPNHAPLVIAEQFGTLATLFPGRIDLGLGRAPGGDMATARALRRGLDGGDGFPRDVLELMAYLAEPDPAMPVQAHPGAGTEVPVWILGSSLYGAELAAYLGLPYAFASHFAPAALEDALATYRATYRPSERWPAPHFMLAVNVFAGADDREGAYLRTSMQQAFANLRSGRPGKLPRPVEDIRAVIGPQMLDAVDAAFSCSATGGPKTVRRELLALVARHRPNEVILTAPMHDLGKRKVALAIAAEALAAAPVEAAA